MDYRRSGVTVWFTGLPGSGKTTIAKELEKTLNYGQIDVERIDGDTLRKTLSKDLGFSEEDRNKNIENVVYIAEMLTHHNIIVLASFISPYRAKRDWARAYLSNFMEVYVNCPIEICEQRDPKGIYKKARKGEIIKFTGIPDPYEEPLNPDLILETNKETVKQSANKVLTALYEKGFIEDSVYLGKGY